MGLGTGNLPDFGGGNGTNGALNGPESLTIPLAVLGCPIDRIRQTDLASPPLGASGAWAVKSGSNSVTADLK